MPNARASAGVAIWRTWCVSVSSERVEGRKGTTVNAYRMYHVNCSHAKFFG